MKVSKIWLTFQKLYAGIEGKTELSKKAGSKRAEIVCELHHKLIRVFNVYLGVIKARVVQIVMCTVPL